MQMICLIKLSLLCLIEVAIKAASKGIKLYDLHVTR